MKPHKAVEDRLASPLPCKFAGGVIDNLPLIFTAFAIYEEDVEEDEATGGDYEAPDGGAGADDAIPNE